MAEAAAGAQPSDVELEAEVKEVLKGTDLTKTSLKEVRAELERRFQLSPGSLDGRKEKLKDLVAAEIARIQDAEAEAEAEEGEEAQEEGDEEGVAAASVEAEAPEAPQKRSKEGKRSSKSKGGQADKKRGREDGDDAGQPEKKKGATKERQAGMMTRAQFMKKAKAFTVPIGDKKLQVLTKTFSTGSCGFYGMGKVEMDIGDQKVSMQCQVSCTVIGSKQWEDK